MSRRLGGEGGGLPAFKPFACTGEEDRRSTARSYMESISQSVCLSVATLLDLIFSLCNEKGTRVTGLQVYTGLHFKVYSFFQYYEENDAPICFVKNINGKNTETKLFGARQYMAGRLAELLSGDKGGLLRGADPYEVTWRGSV